MTVSNSAREIFNIEIPQQAQNDNEQLYRDHFLISKSHASFSEWINFSFTNLLHWILGILSTDFRKLFLPVEFHR